MSKNANHKHVEKDQAENDVKENAGVEVNISAEAASMNTVEEKKEDKTEAGTKAPDVDAFVERAAKFVELEATNKALQEEVSSLKDQYLRKVADYENFRKRMTREKEEQAKYANTSLLTDLIAIVDDFDRAIQSSEVAQDFKTLHDGVSMIQKQFLSMLDSRYALKRFDSKGEAFDPNFHEAVMMDEAEGIEHPVVAEDFLKGYKLHDRIIRTAKVKVSMPSKKASGEAIDSGISEA